MKSSTSLRNPSPTPPSNHHDAAINRPTKFMQLLLKYSHTIDIILLLLKIGSLRLVEIADWSKLRFNMSKATTYRRLQELVHAKMLHKNPTSHKEVHYVIARPARKMILQLLKALKRFQTINQAGTLITQITTPHIIYQLAP